MGQRLSSEAICRAVCEDLGAVEACVRPEHDEYSTGTSVTLLVPWTWLEAAAAASLAGPSGGTPAVPRLPLPPPGVHESDLRLHLQPSCRDPRANSAWRRVSVTCIAKDTATSHRPTVMPPPEPLPECTTFHDFLSMKHAQRQRELLDNLGKSIAPPEAAGAGPDSGSAAASRPARRPITRDTILEILSQLHPDMQITAIDEASEQTQLSAEGLHWHKEEANEGSDSASMGSADEPHSAQSQQRSRYPACASDNGHRNICRPLAVLETARHFYLLFPYRRHSLQDVVTHSPDLLRNSHAKPLFIVYQLLKTLQYLHSNGHVHGALRMSNVMIDKRLWVEVKSLAFHDPFPETPRLLQSPARQLGPAALELNLPDLVVGWSKGWISNFQYLMALNALAGRRMHDPNNHPVLPWVIDFCSETGGWRDLTRSKYRLAKGDEQLEITWASATPHHITDMLSEVTYYVYLSRVTPKRTLCNHVRQKWVPNEYPSSMQRMYRWTPDECIPEFFTDPGIFASMHDDLPELEIPAWTQSPEEFVRFHMEALESDTVSAKLHHWIDLTFGFKLSGQAAVDSKNVWLPLVTPRTELANHGVVQLFTAPHPTRSCVTEVLPLGAPAAAAGLSPRHLEPTPPSSSPVLAPHVQPQQDLGRRPSLGDLKDFSTPQRVRSTAAQPAAGDKAATPALPSASERAGSLDRKSRPKSLTKFIESLSPELSNASPLFSKSRQAAPRVGPEDLPSSFSPLSNIVHLERTEDFLGAMLGAGAPTRQPGRPAAATEAAASADPQAVLDDMYNLGCVAAELFIGDQLGSTCLRSAVSGSFYSEQLQIGQRIHELRRSLPSCVRSGVLALLAPDHQFRPSANELLSQQQFQASPLLTFPVHFSALYSFLFELRSASLSKQPDVTRKWLRQLLKFDDECFDIALPYVSKLYHHTECTAGALELFDAIAAKLGIRRTRSIFLTPIANLHESKNETILRLLYNERMISILMTRFGLAVYLEHLSEDLIKAVAHQSAPVAKLACQSLKWLCGWTGPIVTTRFIIKPLLRLITRPPPNYCYEVMGFLAELFGETVVLSTQLPFVVSKMQKQLNQMSVKGPMVIANGIAWLLRIMAHMKAKSVIANFEELSVKVFQPLLQTIASVHVQFAEGIRLVICRRTVDVLILLSKKLGRELSQDMLLPLLQLFFASFDCVQPEVPPESLGTSPPHLAPSRPSSAELDLSCLSEVFSPEMANLAYSSFCQLIGQETMRRELYNSALIEKLMYDDMQRPEQARVIPPEYVLEEHTANTSPMETIGSGRESPGLLLEYEEVDIGETPGRKAPAANLSGSDLSGAWAELWELQHGARSHIPFTFRNYPMKTFAGHQSAVRGICAIEQDSLLLTGSKDKTVRVWDTSHSASASEEASPSVRTYVGHKKALTDVTYLKRYKLVASCDGSVQIWSPETGRTTRRFEPRKSLAIHVNELYSRSCLVASTTDATLSFVDLRSPDVAQEWRANSFVSGAIRCVSIDPEEAFVAVGFSSGWVTELDLRTGLLRNRWRAHEGEVLQLHALPGGHTVSSSVDQSVLLWQSGKQICQFKGHADAVSSLAFHRNDMITLSTSNRVAVFPDILKQEGTAQSTAVAKMHIKGSVTNLCALPVNQMVAVGTETGHVGLLS